jgi:type III pantothenate kinase
MLRLIIDAGNTNLKLFCFENDIIVSKDIFNSDKEALIFLKEQKINNNILECIVSKVRDISEELEHFLITNYKTLFFSLQLKIPIKITYLTPNTLGHDRIAAVSGASVMFPDQNTLIIDAGTAITYNILEKGNIYHGGAISPGLTTRFKALHTFTGKLPLLSINEEKQNLFGKTTEEAIICGVQNGVLHEVNGVIAEFEKEFQNLTIVFTGGDCFFFEKLLKNRIFAVPNLTAIGLNKILELNV